MHFKCRTSTLLRKVFEAYCERCQIGMHEVRFYKSGQRIHPDSTSLSFGLVNDDTINAVMMSS